MFFYMYFAIECIPTYPGRGSRGTLFFRLMIFFWFYIQIGIWLVWDIIHCRAHTEAEYYENPRLIWLMHFKL
jgi:hypothetical protein